MPGADSFQDDVATLSTSRNSTFQLRDCCVPKTKKTAVYAFQLWVYIAFDVSPFRMGLPDSTSAPEIAFLLLDLVGIYGTHVEQLCSFSLNVHVASNPQEKLPTRPSVLIQAVIRKRTCVADSLSEVSH